MHYYVRDNRVEWIHNCGCTRYIVESIEEEEEVDFQLQILLLESSLRISYCHFAHSVDHQAAPHRIERQATGRRVMRM